MATNYKLERKAVSDNKNVYILRNEEGKMTVFTEGLIVNFSHKGEDLTGSISKLRYHEKFDPYGIADIITKDNKKYSKSLRLLTIGDGMTIPQVASPVAKITVSTEPEVKILKKDKPVHSVSADGIWGKLPSGKPFHSEITRSDDFYTKEEHQIIAKEYAIHARDSKKVNNKERYDKLYKYHFVLSKGGRMQHPFKNENSNTEVFTKALAKAVVDPVKNQKQEEIRKKQKQKMEINEHARLIDEVYKANELLKETNPKKHQRLGIDGLGHEKWDKSALEITLRTLKNNIRL
jgi:hypothetical protein